ncbi:hypothetical protein E1B28_004967 [Marasmius oreades]|uniref:MYND-type domain-containing protein n=1 Tax=Marasmius oreades TaxID=181124 RepID=A0A9P8ADT2_9AGAR|nr:uncharacterized protein E1B28_004967 [Marasmius oreades]KAG7097635.1 hypothetical protein E1B28_004967 [Marasmius oreades]
MPGPGRHKSSKSKRKGHISIAKATPPSYVGEIENADHWNDIVLILCDFFQLPELTTRSGLKKVHDNFDAIFLRLDQACKENSENEKIVGGIIGIYAKMCADSILRNKLFNKGFLPKLMPLLDKPISRHMALRSLSSVAHHGSETVHTGIANYIPKLLKLLDDHPNDPIIAELSITIISHTVTEVMRQHQSVYEHTPHVPSYLKIPPILQSIVIQLKKPSSSRYLIDHALSLLATLSYHDGKNIKANRSVVNFMIAGLRHKSWEYRCMSLSGLIRMHLYESEEDVRQFDPRILLSLATKRFPDDIVDVLMDYGQPRTDLFLTIKTAADFQKAMLNVAQSRDGDRLYPLGLRLYELIMRTEFAIGDGYFEVEDPVTGQRKPMDIGLPFARWSDSLPHCAKAIRAKGIPQEADKADVLDIKHMIMKQKIRQAADMARKSLERNPDFAYYYYAISLVADRTEGLKAAKKGIKCKQTSPFVKHQLLQRAVEHAGDLGIAMLNDAGHDEKKWEEGIALLMSSMEDSKQYASQAPPDNRHMRNVLYWNVLLGIVVRGPDLKRDLGEFEAVLKKVKFTHDFARFTGLPLPRTNLHLAQATVVNNFQAALEEWGDVVDNMAGSGEPRMVDSDKVEDDLSAWLDDLRLDNGEQEPRRAHPKINANHVLLYHCSWCGNPSAVLRKCSGCGLTRYCDSGCQKSHWTEHKKTCKQT